jgi:hypothetical protein
MRGTARRKVDKVRGDDLGRGTTVWGRRRSLLCALSLNSDQNFFVLCIDLLNSVAWRTFIQHQNCPRVVLETEHGPSFIKQVIAAFWRQIK